jgi:hypothetical protein
MEFYGFNSYILNGYDAIQSNMYKELETESGKWW